MPSGAVPFSDAAKDRDNAASRAVARTKIQRDGSYDDNEAIAGPAARSFTRR